MANPYDITELLRRIEALETLVDRQSSHIRRLNLILELRRINCEGEHIWKEFPDFNCKICIHCNDIHRIQT